VRRHAHHMFRQLRVLDFFDFWMKLDDNVRWAGKFPGDITHHLISKHRIFFHAGHPRPSHHPCAARLLDHPAHDVCLRTT
jgi:hypothetical protein